MDCRPSGPSVSGILQARILEWVAMPPPGDLSYPGTESESHVSYIGRRSFTTGATWEAGSLFTFGQLSDFLFLTWPLLGPSSLCMHSLLQDGFQPPKGQWEALASCILGWHPLFDPQGIFLQICNVALAPRMGNIWSYDLLFKQGLALLCPCHIYYLKMFMGDKVHLFTLFLLFSSWSSNRRLVVNIFPGAHLSPASLSYFLLILSFI